MQSSNNQVGPKKHTPQFDKLTFVSFFPFITSYRVCANGSPFHFILLFSVPIGPVVRLLKSVCFVLYGVSSPLKIFMLFLFKTDLSNYFIQFLCNKKPRLPSGMSFECSVI